MKKYLNLIIAAALFGTIGIFIKLTGDSVHPMVLNFYRVFFAFLTLLIICPIRDKTAFKVNKKDIKMYALIGFLLAVSLSLTNTAYMNAPVQNVALLLAVLPFFVFIFAYFILGEKITTVKVITFIIALVGIMIINPIRPEGMFGNLLALAASMIQGVIVVLMRMEDKTHSIGDVMWFFFFASIFLSPFPFIHSFGTITLSLIALGIFSTGFAYFFYNLGLEKHEAETSSIVEIIVASLVGITLAVIIIGESLNFQIVLGGAVLIASGVYFQTHNKKIKEEVEEEIEVEGP